MSPRSSSPGPCPRGPTDAGTPVCPGDARHETSSPYHRAGVSMPTLVVHVHEVTKGAPARRRCRMIADAAAGTAVLPLAVLLAPCGPPPENPETDTQRILSSGPFAHRLPPPWLRPPTPRQGPVRGSGITRPRAST
jgi:hypothetical protein